MVLVYINKLPEKYQYQENYRMLLSAHEKALRGGTNFSQQADSSVCGVVVSASMAAPGTSSPSSPADRNRGPTAKFSSNSSSNFCQTTAAAVSSQNIKSTKKKNKQNMGVDRQLTFEILLYLNIFYFGLYAGMEAIFLLMKYYYVADMDNLTMLNEVFLLLALTGLESARLYLGQEEFIHKKISVVFRILILTVPAQYLTLYFTFWQTKVTQVGI